VFRDNVPCVLLGQWDLQADYFEDEVLSGVIPVLFAENPSEAEKGLLNDLVSARKDLDRINRAFFIPESVDLEMAFKIVKKPRLGEAEFSFKRRNLDRLFEPIRKSKGNKKYIYYL
jgi:ribosome-binding ATPase YchF (GTP1/OBG family)